jgi:hypothetical protein
LGDIQRFLELPTQITAERRYIVPLEPSKADVLPASMRSVLDRFYAEDIMRVADITGLDLADWLDPEYAEPMSP